jgi:hypothetical protein
VDRQRNGRLGRDRWRRQPRYRRKILRAIRCADTYSNTNCDPNVYSDSDTYSNTNCDPNVYSDSNAYSNTNCDPNAHSNTNYNCNANRDSYPNAYADPMRGEMYTDTAASPHSGTAAVVPEKS